jgi:hypothetical protein
MLLKYINETKQKQVSIHLLVLASGLPTVKVRSEPFPYELSLLFSLAAVIIHYNYLYNYTDILL